MFKFFKKKTLQQNQSKQERTEYVKYDLALFCRLNKDEAMWDYNAEKLIKNDKQYFFVGIYNNDRTKIKNVITGEVYETYGYSSNKTRINDFIYEKIEFSNKEITRSHNGPFYYLEVSNKPFYDISRIISTCIKDYSGESPIYTFLKKSSNDVCSITLIKDFVSAINNRIHNAYKKGIASHNEFKHKENKANTTKLTLKDRDF